MVGRHIFYFLFSILEIGINKKKLLPYIYIIPHFGIKIKIIETKNEKKQYLNMALEV